MCMKVRFVILLVIITQGSSQVKKEGECPEVPVVENHDENQFRGRWYEWARTPRLLEPYTKCVHFEYSSPLDGGKIQIGLVQRSPITGLRTKKQIVVTPQQKGVWKSLTGYEYRIVATDYTRYAVVYACNTGIFDIAHGEILWILTREKEPDYATVFEAQYIIVYKMMRSLDDLSLTDHENCPKNDEQLFGDL